MSRLRALRAVSTEMRRKFIKAELRGLTRPSLSIRDGRALTSVEGSADSPSPQVAFGRSAQLTAPTTTLRAATPVTAPSTTLGTTQPVIAAERTGPVTAPALHHELKTLQAVAAQHGITETEFVAIGKQIEALVDTQPKLPTDDGRLAPPHLVAAVESLEKSVLDAVCEAQTIKALRLAAVEALRQVGLTDVTIEVGDGEITVTGRDRTGRTAELELTPSSVVMDVDAPADAVHPLHPLAGDLCEGAAALAADLHAVIPSVFADFGVQIGDVELIEPPTRGALPKVRGRTTSTHRERRMR
ncbi:MAG: hypothetical protein AAB131_02520 [Actinomycetota bacterium]